MSQNSERRHHNRFDLQIPAIIKSAAGDGAGQRLFLTRNISDHGAYLSEIHAQSWDGPVEMEFLLEIPRHEEDLRYVHMSTRGEVIRRDATGLAVRFDYTPILRTFQDPEQPEPEREK